MEFMYLKKKDYAKRLTVIHKYIQYYIKMGNKLNHDSVAIEVSTCLIMDVICKFILVITFTLDMTII